MQFIANPAILPAPVLALFASWGWQLVEDGPAIHFDAVADGIEIRAARATHPDDKIFFPLEARKPEFEWRIEAAQLRQQRLAKRLHDLRSPLNAIQGYAEMIAEAFEGEPHRFASNIRTSSELLTTRLDSMREEGV